MKLYKASGRYVGTQADAKRADKGFRAVEVPTDKEGLITFLNDLAKPQSTAPDDGFDLIAPPAVSVASFPTNAVRDGYTLKPDVDMYETVADRVLSPPDADGIVQRIMAASGYELKRYASAVAQRFAKMGE